jgi:hypothetical protein
MLILERIKKYWLIIMGVLILIIIAFIGNLFIFLENVLSIILLPMLFLLFIYSLEKYGEFKLVSVVIIGFFILYNPNIKDFESYYKYENNIPNNQVLSENILRTNFILFSQYKIKNISHETNSSIQETTLSNKYLGALGNFWEKKPLLIKNTYIKYKNNILEELDELKSDPKYYISDFIGITK